MESKQSFLIYLLYMFIKTKYIISEKLIHEKNIDEIMKNEPLFIRVF